jgi:hypothetical protein
MDFYLESKGVAKYMANETYNGKRILPLYQIWQFKFIVSPVSRPYKPKGSLAKHSN